MGGVAGTIRVQGDRDDLLDVDGHLLEQLAQGHRDLGDGSAIDFGRVARRFQQCEQILDLRGTGAALLQRLKPLSDVRHRDHGQSRDNGGGESVRRAFENAGERALVPAQGLKDGFDDPP